MGRVVAFGAQNLGLQMSNLASRTVDVFAVGRGIGAEPLGVYIRANQMVSLVFQQLLAPLTRVVIPMLTAEKGIARINASLLHLQLGISYSMFAALSLLAVLASPFVPVILGKEWAAMGPVVQIVCIGAAFQALGYIYYWAFLALQRSDLLLISELPGRIVMMLGSVSVVSLGIEVVAGVMSAGLLIIWITGTLFFAPRLGIDVRGLVRTGMRPLLLFGGAAGLPIALRASGWPPAAGYGIAPSLVGLGAWLGVLGLGLLLPWVRSDVAEAFSMLRRG